jgi:predicted nucleic acid-binding protein
VITAVDASVLLDVFGADTTFGPRSMTALSRCQAEGSVVACDVVWAETGASFKTASDAAAAFASSRIDFSPLATKGSLTASESWRAYREAGGSQERVIADFLIGAHALTQADRLLTRDRGFYRRYFAALDVIDPTHIA